MQKYRNSVASSLGRPVIGATVTVLTYPGGVAATIYSDNGVTRQTNPITTDANGGFSFYAADGRYTVQISGTGLVTQTINDVLLEDPTDGGSPGSFTTLTVATTGTLAGSPIQSLVSLGASGTAAAIGSTGGTVQTDLDARPTRSSLSAPGTAAIIGSSAGTVQTDIDARPTSATLAASSGSSLVGDGTTTVADRLSAINLASYTALRAYAGANQSAYITGYLVSAKPSGTAGLFTRDDSDTTSADNGGTIIVASNGKRWKRSYAGPVQSAWFAPDAAGVADATAALQAALTAATNGRFVLSAGTYKATAALVPASNTTIVLEAGALVQMATVDLSVINATNKTNVQVYGPGKLQTTGTTGTASYVGLVNFDGATGCLAYGVEIQGNQWAGVFMRNATNCHAVRNHVHDSLAAVQDSAGIVIMDNCVDCSASHNRLINTGNHGVLCQGSTAGTVPLRSLIENNVIDGPIAYGIICYQITTLNQYTLVQGNRVANVTGSYTGGSKGAGIYIQNAGAVRVLGNGVRNVCTATANNTLTPGGIGVNNVNAGLVPPMIEGNTLVDIGITAAGVSNPNAITVAGINVSSSTVGANIGPNVYAQGIASTTMTPQYFGVYINASSNVIVGPQLMQIANTLTNSQGIFAYANGVSISNITIDGGNIAGCDYAAVRADRSSVSYSITGFSVTGTQISGGSNNVRGLLLNGIVGGAATGVVCRTGTGVALSIANSTQFRVQGGTYTSTGATAVLTNGVCTDSTIDESTYIGGLPGSMNNAGTGLRAYVQLAAVPASGTWAAGDHWRTTTPAAATSPGGYCTGAGVPGTWKGEAALAA